MYLKDHYAILNRGEENFGIHSGAVLLDPGKTFGSNVIPEIYNRSNQPVINPHRIDRSTQLSQIRSKTSSIQAKPHILS